MEIDKKRKNQVLFLTKMLKKGPFFALDYFTPLWYHKKKHLSKGKNMKNTLRILLVFVLCLTFLSSCADKTIDVDDFGNDGYVLSDAQKLRPEWVLKIGDGEVTFAEYRYHYLNTKYEMDGGVEDFWEDHPEYINVLKNKVEDSLIEIYSIRELCKEAQIDSDMNAVYDAIDEYKKDMSSSEFKEGLTQHYLTEALYAYTLEGYQLYDALYNHFFAQDGKKAMSDKEVIDYAKEYYTHAKHILIYPNTSMTEEAYTEHLNTVLERVQSGEDFDTLIAEFSNDAAMPEYGYYFLDFEKHENFVNACKELDEGEVSDLVKTSDGWHIIKKLPVDEEDADVLRDIIYNRKYSDMIENKIETISVEYCAEYDLIAPDSLK